MSVHILDFVNYLWSYQDNDTNEFLIKLLSKETQDSIYQIIEDVRSLKYSHGTLTNLGKNEDNLRILDSVSRKLRTMSKNHILIGRNEGCDIVISEPGVSGNHLSVYKKGKNRIQVMDLESTNGTWFEGKRLISNQFETVEEGSKLMLGKNVYIIVI